LDSRASASASSEAGRNRLIGVVALVASLMGLVGLVAFRSGQALAFLPGTCGLRAASQFALNYVLSGHCSPAAGTESSAFAASRDALRTSTPNGGEAKGRLSARTRPVARSMGTVPPGFALIAPFSSARGFAKGLWGLLLGASAAFGALLRLVWGGSRTSVSGRSVSGRRS